MSQVGLPLTGAGDTTANVATDFASSAHYQYVKIVDGAAGSTTVSAVLATTPTGTEGAKIVRPIISTAFVQPGILTSGSSATIIGQVAISSANNQAVTLQAGSSATVVGQVAISSGNSINLALGTTANYQQFNSLAFSSGAVVRSSVSTTIDIQLIAANANRKGLIIANRSTAQTVGVGFSTASVTTALANVDLFIAPSASITFGGAGNLPLYQGPLRGINLTSTAVAGSVGVTEFS